MDSLTQIVLGAAVGEAVAGKKLGNRAMLWGAIAGTIPDLDVLSSPWLNDLERIVAHRGISHSLLFAFLFPFLIAWLVKKLYDSALYKKRWYKWFVTLSSTLFVCAIMLGINWIFYQSGDRIQPLALAVSLILAGLFIFWILRWYLQDPLPQVRADYRTWYLLFFWAILTHPILDAFTTYGTQLFLPFSNTRVAFNNIAVVDPFYTIPFLVCLLVALSIRNGSVSRRVWNWAGIGISTAYMILTLVQKNDVDRKMEAALVRQGISCTQTFSSPTLFNNRLWHCVALTAGDTCYQAFYSRKDSRPEWVFTPLVRNQALIAGHEGDPALEVLRWFSQGLDAVRKEPDGTLSWLDLRFSGVSPDDVNLPEWVFAFDLKLADNRITASEKEPDMKRVGDSWRQFMKRQRGL